MTSLEYIAGFFDGEGSVGLYGRPSGKILRAAITQCRSEVADRFFCELGDRWGGGVSYTKQYHPHHRPAMMWWVYSERAATFLEAIRPHLLMKADQVDLVIQWQRMPNRNAGAGFVILKLNELRSKGPKRAA